jgi:putative DNA methylase
LTCRTKSSIQTKIDRRGFIKLLQSELPELLQAMQTAGVTPLDLAQASIGPGMSVFTRFESILEPDGSKMSVRYALGLIRQCVDEILEDQVADLDPVSRFCLKWFMEYGWNDGISGVADQLARSTNTTIAELSRGGVFEAKAGKARLIRPEEMPSTWDPLIDKSISIWEVTMQIAQAVSSIGLEDSSNLLSRSSTKVDVQTVKELSYLLYNISEKRGWMESAVLFNGLGTSWSSLHISNSALLLGNQEQMTFNFETAAREEES